MSADEPGPCSRRLSREQRRALLEVRQRVNPKGRPQEFLQDLVSLIGQIVRTKVAVAGKRGRSWVVAAESTAEPSIAVHANGGAHPFDRMSATPGVRVEMWRTPDRDWTLVGLAGQADPPVILILEGDWTPCALVFRDLARSFFFSEGEHGACGTEPGRHLPAFDSRARRHVGSCRGRRSRAASRRAGGTQWNGLTCCSRSRWRVVDRRHAWLSARVSRASPDSGWKWRHRSGSRIENAAPRA